MGINAISSNNHGAYTKHMYTKSATSADKNAPTTTDEAVSVRISNEALEKLRANNQGTSNLDASTIKSVLPSREEVTARKTSPMEQVQRQEIEVTGIYSEETLAYFVDTQLSGKLDKSNQIANQMETMIRGAVYNKDATVEQRAIDREAALKLAQHIADNYFENPEEAKLFLDTVNKFADNDILREKGYVVLDNSDIAPFKSYTMPGAPADHVRMDYETLRDTIGGSGTQKEKEAKLKSISDDIVERFNDNEKSVSDTIERVKTAMSKNAVDSSFVSNLENLFSGIKPEQVQRWNGIFSLLNPAQSQSPTVTPIATDEVVIALNSNADVPNDHLTASTPSKKFEYATIEEYKAALKISGKPTDDEIARRMAYRDTLRGAEITPEERTINPERLAESKDQAAKYAPIQAKMMSGQVLTAQEKSFLRDNYPAAYNEAVRVESEVANLRSQLDSAKTKDDAQRIYTDTLMRTLSTSKENFNPGMAAALEKAYRGF